MASNNLEDWLETSGVYKTLVDSSPDAINIHIDGKIVFANPAAIQLWGARSPAQVLGQPILDHIPTEYRDEINQSIVKLIEFGHSAERIETKYQRLDGTLVGVMVESGVWHQDQAATRSTSVTSTPSLNFTPVITLVK